MQRLVIADLIASGTTDSNAVIYMEEQGSVNGAAAVAEGAVKPESTLIFVQKTDLVKKIATWLPVTDEMLDDVPQLRSYIDGRLVVFVQQEEEDQILNGDGIGPNITGIRNRVGLAPDVVRTDPENNMDAILRQASAIAGASYMFPDAVVMNPADWQTIMLTKATNGEYLAGGPFSSPLQQRLWGLNVVVTPAMPAATALVGAFQLGAQIFRKGGIAVEAANTHADYFIRNMTAIRAEERFALAVYTPGAFGEVTSLGVPVVVGP
jgi:HK97 family phage major capsid protein